MFDDTGHGDQLTPSPWNGKTSRMSSKGKKPAHQNTFKFTHNPHSALTKQILASPIEGLCEKCTKVLEWKKDYRKYKPLTVPKRCTSCQQKNIVNSYHIVCSGCATSKKICAKCRQPVEAYTRDYNEEEKKAKEERELQAQISLLRERERRTVLRQLEKQANQKDEEDDSTDDSKEKDSEESNEEHESDQQSSDEDEQSSDQQSLDQQPLDQQPLDQQPLDQQPLDQPQLDQPQLDQPQLDQQPLDQSSGQQSSETQEDESDGEPKQPYGGVTTFRFGKK